MLRMLIFLCLMFASNAWCQEYAHKIGLIKYNGGGDWYSNLETSLPNLIKFTNKELGTRIDPNQGIVEIADKALFNYPFVHLTGHGNIVLNDNEVQNLRKYLVAGGFLHVDDNYGLDPYIRPELKKVFPELDFIELPASHPIFNQAYAFPKGLPKIHVHDNERPQALALFYKGRMVCLYTYEADLGDGWEDPRVHNDTEENHLKALQMGANILQYVFMNNEPVG